MAVEMRYVDYVKEGADVFKANMVPSLICGAIIGGPVILGAGGGAVGAFVPGIGPIISLASAGAAFLLALVVPIAVVNYLAAVKAYKQEGKAIEPGALLNFENVADKWIGCFITGLGFMCYFVPGALLFFAPCIIADRPGIGFMNAVKGALQFGKANAVPMILLALLTGVVAGVGGIACLIGLAATYPIALAATWIAYDEHKSAVEAAAAEGGVQL